MRRHHLIEEAKAELDVAYGEVRRAEHEIMALEGDYNERLKALDSGDSDMVQALTREKEERQAAFDIEMLYDLQHIAIQRFAHVSAAFTIVSSIESEKLAVDLIREILFRHVDMAARRFEIDRAIRSFVRGLRNYTKVESSPTNDAMVRDAWSLLEGILRDVDEVPVRAAAV